MKKPVILLSLVGTPDVDVSVDGTSISKKGLYRYFNF